MGLRKHELLCMAVGKWLEEIASGWTPILQFLQHLFKIPYWDTEQNVCSCMSGTSPSKRPNAISHLCLLDMCTDVSSVVIAIYVYSRWPESCFSPLSVCIIFSCLHHVWAPVLCTLLSLGPEVTVPLVFSRQRGKRESEIGKATGRGRNRLLRTGVRCCKAWQKAPLHTKSSASFFRFGRSLQRSRRSKSCFAYTTDLAVLSSASHVSKMSRKWIDVSRQPALETHTHPFCFISCLSPQFHY